MAKSALSFLLIIALTLSIALVAVYGLDLGPVKIPKVSDPKNGIKQGLDLVGGSSITYEATIPEGTSAVDVANGMKAIVASLQSRLTTLGFTEATVARSGANRVVVEIPAVSDPASAVKMLGSTAELQFRDADGKVWLTGKDVSKAVARYGPTNNSSANVHYVELTFKTDAVKKFADATRTIATKTAGNKNYLEIVLDNVVQSAPFVSAEINSESCTISGSFTGESAAWLASIITAGQLPFSLTQVELRSIGPTLGEKSLSTSLTAGLIGLILIMIFMIAVYRLPGVVASIALAFYTALMAEILAIFHVNLSLPGIAGMILSIGMAVDANVIIFERIKEELRLGKTLKASITAGFSRALTAIIDSNVTTIIAAVVLLVVGTGPVKGFAITLLIGVILSMFTAIFVSKFMLDSLVNMNVKNIKAYGA